MKNSLLCDLENIITSMKQQNKDINQTLRALKRNKSESSVLRPIVSNNNSENKNKNKK